MNFTKQSPYFYHTGNSSESITLTRLGIKYPAGAKTMEIIGTTAIPEFGSSVILAITIGSILVFSRQQYFRLQKVTKGSKKENYEA